MKSLVRSATRAIIAIAIATSCLHAGTEARTRVEDFKACFVRSPDPLASSKAARPTGKEVKVTFLGTTTLLIEDEKTQLLVDGFLSRPSLLELVGKIKTDKRVVKAALRRAGADEQRLRAVFVSHSHYDHALDVAYIAALYPNAVLYGSPSTMWIGVGGKLKGTPTPDCGTNPQQTQGIKLCQFVADDAFTVDNFHVRVLASKHSPATPFNDDLGQEILKELKQPAKFSDYKEGFSFDFLITHGEDTILVKPSANFVDKPLPRADVLFQGTGRMAKQDCPKDFMSTVFKNTVVAAHPKLVVPVHWDDFFDPLNETLHFPTFADDSATALEFLIREIDRLNRDPAIEPKIAFRMLQGFQSIMLFKKGGSLTAPLPETGGLNCEASPEN